LNKPVIKIEGRSGCKIEILQTENKFIVRKTSNRTEYNERLKKQCQKQADFISTKNCSSPPILNSEINAERLFFFEMPYITGDKYSEYLVKAEIESVNRFISSLIGYIDGNLKNAPENTIDPEIIKIKILEVKEAINKELKDDPFLQKEFNYLISNIPKSKIPIGVCHGDLTLSNLIVSNETIFVIDFLDSFIESPVIDFIKLRQETKFKWSLHLEKDIPAYQKNKIIQIMNYFDEQLVKHYTDNIHIKNWYSFLEKFNLIRILPYINDKTEEQFIINALKITNQ
jgi:aminoglycoside phosphotransferase (APT) family kinase protein